MSGGSGWLFTGAVFWLMAAGGLVPVMGAAVRWLRRGGQPQPATAGGTFGVQPPVRAQFPAGMGGQFTVGGPQFNAEDQQ